MERSNQPPKPECCLQPGQEPESPGMTAPNDLREAYTGQKRGPQAGFTSCLSNSASKCLAADGDGLGMPEPNTDRAVAGEALEGLPGSKSVARAAAAARNQGDPGGSRRTNYEGQAGIGAGSSVPHRMQLPCSMLVRMECPLLLVASVLVPRLLPLHVPH